MVRRRAAASTITRSLAGPWPAPPPIAGLTADPGQDEAGKGEEEPAACPLRVPTRGRHASAGGNRGSTPGGGEREPNGVRGRRRWNLPTLVQLVSFVKESRCLMA
jgi:hypothetical protein